MGVLNRFVFVLDFEFHLSAPNIELWRKQYAPFPVKGVIVIGA